LPLRHALAPSSSCEAKTALGSPPPKKKGENFHSIGKYTDKSLQSRAVVTMRKCVDDSFSHCLRRKTMHGLSGPVSANGKRFDSLFRFSQQQSQHLVELMQNGPDKMS